MYDMHEMTGGTLRTEICVIHNDEPMWLAADLDLCDPVLMAYAHPVKGTVVQFAMRGEVRISTALDDFRAARDAFDALADEMELKDRLGI